MPTSACAAIVGRDGAEHAARDAVPDGLLDVVREERLGAPHDVVARGGRAEDQLEDLAVVVREAAERPRWRRGSARRDRRPPSRAASTAALRRVTASSTSAS